MKGNQLYLVSLSETYLLPLPSHGYAPPTATLTTWVCPSHHMGMPLPLTLPPHGYAPPTDTPITWVCPSYCHSHHMGMPLPLPLSPYGYAPPTATPITWVCPSHCHSHHMGMPLPLTLPLNLWKTYTLYLCSSVTDSTGKISLLKEPPKISREMHPLTLKWNK